MRSAISAFCCDELVSWVLSKKKDQQHQQEEQMGCAIGKRDSHLEDGKGADYVVGKDDGEPEDGDNEEKARVEHQGSAKSISRDLRLSRVSVGSTSMGGAANMWSRVHVGRSAEEDYEVEESCVLGRGYSGPVIRGKEKLRGTPVAIKSFQKGALNSKQWDDLRTECEVYLGLDHPNIAKLRDVYETGESMTLVMQLCLGGELFGRLSQRQVYAEPDAASCVSGMLLAVRYLHDEGVVHRDLKLQNWLYPAVEAGDGDIKLIDFGFSKLKDDDPSKWEAAGSIEYMPPEVFRREEVGPPCDMWAMGVIVFMLLAGYPPFHGDARKIMRNVVSRQVLWLKRRWKDVSDIGRDLVEKLLAADPAKRLSAADALDHPWLKIHETVKEGSLDVSVVTALRDFSKQSRLRKAACMLMSHCLTPEERFEIEENFKLIDTSKTGTILFDEFKDILQKRTGDNVGGETITRKNSNPSASTGSQPKIQRMTTAYVTEVFSALNMQGEDKVYYTDFCTAVLSQDASLSNCEQLLRATFDRMDADYSGAVSVENLRHLFGNSFEGVGVEELVKEADFNGDGYIQFDEFVKFMTEKRKPLLITEEDD